MSRHLHSLPLHLRLAEALAAAIAAYLLLFLLPWGWLLGSHAEVLALLRMSKLPCSCNCMACHLCLSIDCLDRHLLLFVFRPYKCGIN